MEPIATSDETTPPVTPNQPPASAMASSRSLGRIVLISLGVLGLGLAIAFGGYYYGQKSNKQVTMYPSPTASAVSPTLATASPTAVMKNTTTYTNTTYGYSLEYPKDLQVQGEGIQITNETAPEVLFAPKVNIATPDPLRAFHVAVYDMSNLGANGKPMLSFTPKELADMDLQKNVDNKNTYTATLSPVTKLQPLAEGFSDGYTFTIRSKGYETVNGGTLWELGDYVITTLYANGKRYVLVYSATDEMRQMAISFHLIK